MYQCSCQIKYIYMYMYVEDNRMCCGESLVCFSQTGNVMVANVLVGSSGACTHVCNYMYMYVHYDPYHQ